MEIRDTSKTNPGRESGHEVATTERRERRLDQAGTGGSTPSDRVTLTETAQQLMRGAQLTGTAPVDQARIESIRQAIADGTYPIDSARIAARLLDFDNSQ